MNNAPYILYKKEEVIMAMLTIGGTAVVDPSVMSVSIMDVSNAERNANGTMMIDRVATKRKIVLEWPALTNSNISAILNAVSPIFFTVKYPDPMDGGVATRTFYVGDRTAPVYSDIGGTVQWNGLKMDFIQQ